VVPPAPPNPIAITITNVNQATGDLTYTSTDSGFNASPYVNNVSTTQVFQVQGSQTYPFGSTLVTTLNGGSVSNDAKITIKNTLGVLISNEYTITFPTLPVATINYFRGTDGTFGYTSTEAISANIYINDVVTAISPITLAKNTPNTSYITVAQLKTDLYGGPIENGDVLTLKTLDGLQKITTDPDYTISVPIPLFVTITALDLANGILSYTSTAEAQATVRVNSNAVPGMAIQQINISPTPSNLDSNIYLAAITNGGSIADNDDIDFYTGNVVISYPYTVTVPIVIFINSVNPSTGDPPAGDVKYTCTTTITVYPAINGVKVPGAPSITIPASSPPGTEDTINIPEFRGLAIGDYVSFITAADTTVSTTYYAYWLQYESGNNPSATPPITENALVSDTQVNLCGTNITFKSRQLFGAVDNFTFSFTLPVQSLQTVGNILSIGLVDQSINNIISALRLVVQSSTLSGFPILNSKINFNQLYNSFTNILGSTVSVNYIKAGDSDYNTLYDFVYIKNETSGAILSSMSLIGEAAYGAPGTPPFIGQVFAPWYIDIRGAIGYNPPGANIPYSITNMTRGVTVKPALPTSLTPTCYLFNNQKTALSPYENTSTNPTLLYQTSLSYITNTGAGISDLLWLDDDTATGKLFIANNLVSTTDGSRIYRINTNAELVYQTQFGTQIFDTLQTIPACDNKGYLYGTSQVAYWRVDQRIAYPTWRTSIVSSFGNQNGPFREPLLTTGGFLFCFNKQTNGMNKINTSTGISSASCTFTASPTSVSEMVMTTDESFIYFIGRDASFHYLYKIQVSDCTEVSRMTISGITLDFSAPRLSFDGTSVYAYRDVNLYSVNLTTGALNWTNTSATGSIQSIAIGPSGTIFLSARDRFVRAINSSGVLQWTSEDVNAYNIQLIVDQQNRVYCAGEIPNITLTALNGDTGATVWQKSYSNNIRSPTIGSDGKLYVAANNTLYVYGT
jgi:outer membrane protein assembly factor BamB